MNKKVLNIIIGILMIFLSNLINLFSIISNKIYPETFNNENSYNEIFLHILRSSYYFPLLFIIFQKRIKLKYQLLLNGIILSFSYLVIFIYIKDESKKLNLVFYIILIIIIGQCSSNLFLIAILLNLQLLRFKNIIFLLAIFLSTDKCKLNGLIYNLLNLNEDTVAVFFEYFYFVPIIIILVCIIYYLNNANENINSYSLEKNKKQYQIYKEKVIVKFFFFINLICVLLTIIIMNFLSKDFQNLLYMDLVLFWILLLNFFVYLIEKAKLIDRFLMKRYIKLKSEKTENENIFNFENSSRKLLIDDYSNKNSIKYFCNIKKVEPTPLKFEKHNLKTNFNDENKNLKSDISKKVTFIENQENSAENFENNNKVNKHGNNPEIILESIDNLNFQNQNFENHIIYDYINIKELPNEVLNIDKLKEETSQKSHSKEKNEFLNINNNFSSPVMKIKENDNNIKILNIKELDFKLNEFEIVSKECLNGQIEDKINLKQSFDNFIPDIRNTMPLNTLITKAFLKEYQDNDTSNFNLNINEKNPNKKEQLNLNSYINVERNTMYHTLGHKANKKINFDKFYDYTIHSSESDNSDRGSLDNENKKNNYNGSSNNAEPVFEIVNSSRISNIKNENNQSINKCFNNLNSNSNRKYSISVSHSYDYYSDNLPSFATNSEDFRSFSLLNALRTWEFFHLIFIYFIVTGVSNGILNNTKQIIIKRNFILVESKELNEDSNFKHEIFNIEFISFIAFDLAVVFSSFYINKLYEKNYKKSILLIYGNILLIISQIFGLIENFTCFKICIIFLSVSLGICLLYTFLILRIKFGLIKLGYFYSFLLFTQLISYLSFTTFIYNSNLNSFLKGIIYLDEDNPLNRFLIPFSIGFLFSLGALLSSYKIYKNEDCNLKKSIVF